MHTLLVPLAAVAGAAAGLERPTAAFCTEPLLAAAAGSAAAAAGALLLACTLAWLPALPGLLACGCCSWLGGSALALQVGAPS